MTAKMTNDAVAFIRSLAELRGRNADWAEKAVREAASLSANAALQAARRSISSPATRPSCSRQIDGRTVEVAGGETRQLATQGLTVETLEPGWLIRLLSVITDPNVAVILMLVGVYGLIFEFTTPGASRPASIGTIASLLGLYALNLLPIDYAGLALMLLGHDLPDRRGLQSDRRTWSRRPRRLPARHGDAVQGRGAGFRLSPAVVGLAAALIFALVAVRRPRALARPPPGRRASAARRCAACRPRSSTGELEQATCCANGERWQARGDETFAPGETVEVATVNGLTLMVRRRPGAAAAEGETPMTLDYLPYLLVAVIVVIFLSSAIRILREYQRGVVFTLGRFTGVKGPGLIILDPLRAADGEGRSAGWWSTTCRRRT